MKVVYYFTAEWCQPCKKMKPMIEDIKRDNSEIGFQMIDVDGEPELTGRFEIKSVPTFILFNKGVEVERISGAVDKQTMLNFINQ